MKNVKIDESKNEKAEWFRKLKKCELKNGRNKKKN